MTFAKRPATPARTWWDLRYNAAQRRRRATWLAALLYPAVVAVAACAGAIVVVQSRGEGARIPIAPLAGGGGLATIVLAALHAQLSERRARSAAWFRWSSALAAELASRRDLLGAIAGVERWLDRSKCGDQCSRRAAPSIAVAAAVARGVPIQVALTAAGAPPPVARAGADASTSHELGRRLRLACAAELAAIDRSTRRLSRVLPTAAVACAGLLVVVLALTIYIPAITAGFTAIAP